MPPLSVTGFGTSLTELFLRRNREAEARALEHLASGRKLLRGSDDPAGLISASRLDLQIRALEAELYNLERFDANANIVDGHLAALSSMSADLQALLVKGANSGALGPDEQAATQLEIDAVVSSLQKFGGDALHALQGIALPDGGSAALAEKLQGALSSLTALTNGGSAGLASGAYEEAQSILSAAATAFAEARGAVGGYQKYDLRARAGALEVERSNLFDARSRIVDADFAEETSALHRAQILSQASVFALRALRRSSEQALKLLGP